MSIVKVSVESMDGRQNILYDYDKNASLEENVVRLLAKFEMVRELLLWVLRRGRLLLLFMGLVNRESYGWMIFYSDGGTKPPLGFLRTCEFWARKFIIQLTETLKARLDIEKTSSRNKSGRHYVTA